MLLFVLSISFSISSSQLFFLIFALGCKSLIFSERKKRRRTSFEQGPTSAFFIIISIFDFRSRFCLDTPLIIVGLRNSEHKDFKNSGAISALSSQFICFALLLPAAAPAHLYICPLHTLKFVLIAPTGYCSSHMSRSSNSGSHGRCLPVRMCVRTICGM